MDGKLFSEPPGIVILVFLVLLLVASVILVVCCRKLRDVTRYTQDSTNKYRLIENQYVPLDTPQCEAIQPPSDSRIKVRLVPSTIPVQDKKRVLRYSEERGEHDGRYTDNNNKTNGKKSFINYREKIFGLLNKSKQNNNNRQTKRYSKPDIIEEEWEREKSKSLRRLQRPDSVYDEFGLGKINFTLAYSRSEELLTVHLISGRQIYSNDESYQCRLPAVSIQIEGNTETEVVSNPDEAPNPEYDQEFSFPLREFELHGTVLRFTIWDIISNNESRVIGFFRVDLTNFQELLKIGTDSRIICREIVETLNDENAENLGEILISLHYDCVTDKIAVTLQKLKNLTVTKDDIDVYIKVSFLLDNNIIQSKQTATFTSSTNITIKQTFEFNALSNELDRLSVGSPQIRVTNELLSHTSQSSRNTLRLSSVDSRASIGASSSSSIASETLRNSMGILISVRSATSNRNKRVVGRLYIGKTNIPTNDEDFHWLEMINNFDNTITHWHSLKLKKI